MSTMKVYSFAVILLMVVVSLAFAGCTAPATDPKNTEMRLVAGELTSSINTGLGEIDAGLSNASGELSTSGLSGPKAEEILSRNLKNYPWAFSSIAVSPEGIVMAAVPGSPEVHPGLDMSGRAEIIEANTIRIPHITPLFRMLEGTWAVSQSYPVFTPSGEYRGYIDITYAPKDFLGEYIGPVMNRTGYDVWVIQSDGTEVYDTSLEEIGKNILTDAIYTDPSVKAVSSSIVSEPSGTGKYTFWDRSWNGNVTKTAVWETAGINGAAWRVGVTREESSSG